MCWLLLLTSLTVVQCIKDTNHRSVEEGSQKQAGGCSDSPNTEAHSATSLQGLLEHSGWTREGRPRGACELWADRNPAVRAVKLTAIRHVTDAYLLPALLCWCFCSLPSVSVGFLRSAVSTAGSVSGKVNVRFLHSWGNAKGFEIQTQLNWIQLSRAYFSGF